MLLTLSTLSLAGLSLLAPAADTCNSTPQAKTVAASLAGTDIVDTAVAAGSFETLVAAVKAAGLVEALKGEGPFTVFAPTDEAFAQLPEGTLAKLLTPEGKDQLTAILTYHVVPGRVLAADVAKLSGAVTLGGQRVDVRVAKKKVMIDGASVVRTDIECSNGVIHVIDSVLMPATNDIVATAKAAGSFGTLLAAAEAAGLVEALQARGPITLFAPTDEAFAALPEGTVADLLKPENKEALASILKLHVVRGRVYSDAAVEAGKATTLAGTEVRISAEDDKVRVGSATVLRANLDASNGVIHVIDSVILPAAH